MAITDGSPVSASNLGAAVGLAAEDGGTGGKPVSAENLAAIIDGGGLLALKTLWEGDAHGGDLVITDPALDAQRIYVIDVDYKLSGGSTPVRMLLTMSFGGSRAYSFWVWPSTVSSSYQRNFSGKADMDTKKVTFNYNDTIGGIVRVRGGGLSS